MFKYKSTKFIILIAFFIVSILLFKIWEREKIKSEKLLSNNVRFTGIITELKKSRNHTFGIISLKVIKSNSKVFLLAFEKEIYPYAIKDSVAEIYHYISPILKKGIRVELDSDKNNLNFYDKNTFLYNSGINYYYFRYRYKVCKREF